MERDKQRRAPGAYRVIVDILVLRTEDSERMLDAVGELLPLAG